MILMYVCVYSIIGSKFDQSLMSARSVNSNLITMLKFNLTEIDVTFQCNISRAKLMYILTTPIQVFIQKIVNIYLREVSFSYLNLSR